MNWAWGNWMPQCWPIDTNGIRYVELEPDHKIFLSRVPPKLPICGVLTLELPPI